MGKILSVTFDEKSGAHLLSRPGLIEAFASEEQKTRFDNLRCKIFETVRFKPWHDSLNNFVLRLFGSKQTEVFKPNLPAYLVAQIDELEKSIQSTAAEEIRDLFAAAPRIHFSARRMNWFQCRKVMVVGCEYWIDLEFFFHSIGVTAFQLAPIFGGPPLNDNDYGKLECFYLSVRSFIKIAKLIKKPIRVKFEDGEAGWHQYMYTVHPNGKIAKPSKITPWYTPER